MKQKRSVIASLRSEMDPSAIRLIRKEVGKNRGEKLPSALHCAGGEVVTQGGPIPSPRGARWHFHSSPTPCPAGYTGLFSPKQSQLPSRLVRSSLSDVLSVKGSIKASVIEADVRNEKAAEPRGGGTTFESAIDFEQRFEVGSLIRMLGFALESKEDAGVA